MPKKARRTKMLMIAAVVALAFQTAGAQADKPKPTTAAGEKTGAGGETSDRTKTLRAAADALGMVRWSDIGAGNIKLPGVDVITTMELWGNGTTYDAGKAYKTEYHVALSYNPPAMRVEMTRTPEGGGGAPEHLFQTVREKYAWNESELGAGLVPGKGTATPAMAALNDRLLQLWTLPYGVVKGAIAAGEKTAVTKESGATVITFPLSGPLAGVTVKATLDANNLITKVETRSDNPALANMATETQYSDYADHGEILTDIKSPGHIVRKQGGRPVLDIQMKTVDANNPYLVFPVPEGVKKASAQGPASGNTSLLASVR
jgi:hypothetical protein